MRFVILAAGKSRRIYKKIKKLKCLLKIRNKSLIIRTIEEIKKLQKKPKISVVTGFQSKTIEKELKNFKNIHFLKNNSFHKTEMLHSLYLALKKYDEDLIFCYSDIVFSYLSLKKMMKNKCVTVLLKKKLEENLENKNEKSFN